MKLGYIVVNSPATRVQEISLIGLKGALQHIQTCRYPNLMRNIFLIFTNDYYYSNYRRKTCFLSDTLLLSSSLLPCKIYSCFDLDFGSPGEWFYLQLGLHDLVRVLQLASLIYRLSHAGDWASSLRWRDCCTIKMWESLKKSLSKNCSIVPEVREDFSSLKL